MPAVIRPQRIDVDPPLGKASDSEADNAVHEFKIANASPSIDRGEKFRFSSCLIPSAASWSASCTLLLRRSAPEAFRRLNIDPCRWSMTPARSRVYHNRCEKGREGELRDEPHRLLLESGADSTHASGYFLHGRRYQGAPAYVHRDGPR